MKILLIAPEFYGYWDAARWGFEQLGHEVEVSVYDRRATLRDSFTYAVDVHIPRKLRGRNPNPELHRRALEIVRPRLEGGNHDSIVVINGAVVGSEVFEDARRRGIPVVLWLQDELSRLIFHTVDSLKVFSGVGTYSARDVEFLRASGINSQLVPNGYDSRLALSGEPRSRDVVFIGARDAHRAEILTSLTMRGAPVVAYGNEWSHRLRDRARALSWERPDIKSRPNVTRDEASKLIYHSLCAVNIHVPGIQDGINPRTFEICGIGGVQATDRPDIASYYEPGKELLRYSSVDELADMVQRISAEPRLASSMRKAARKRTEAEHTIVHRCRQLVDLM